jgi:hypothetical protein
MIKDLVLASREFWGGKKIKYGVDLCSLETIFKKIMMKCLYHKWDSLGSAFCKGNIQKSGNFNLWNLNIKTCKI